jgi:hypothetical protein
MYNKSREDVIAILLCAKDLNRDWIRSELLERSQKVAVEEWDAIVKSHGDQNSLSK